MADKDIKIEPIEVTPKQDYIEGNFVPVEVVLTNIVPTEGGTVLRDGKWSSSNYVKGESGFAFFENGTAEINEGLKTYASVRLAGTSAASNGNYGVFWNVPADCTVISITESHEGKGTDGGAVTLDIEKLTSGQGVFGGSAMLATPMSLKTDDNVPQTPALTTTVANLSLSEGDRIGLKQNGTPTNVYGLVVTITVQF